MTTLSCGICRFPIINSDIVELPRNGTLEKKVLRQRKISQNSGNSGSGDLSGSSSASDYTSPPKSHYFKKNEAIASAGCGHLFHKRCLALKQAGLAAGSSCPSCEVLREGEATRQDSFHDNPDNDSSPKDFQRDGSVCKITRRSYLRKKIIELKELDGGIQSGCRVVCFPDNPEEGTVKWLGKINQIIYIGVEFDNPVGNNFPETNGAPPFPCNLTHASLVLRNDLVLASEYFRLGSSASSTPSPMSARSTLNSSLDSFDLHMSSMSDNVSADPLVEEFFCKLDSFYDLCIRVNSSLDKSKAKLDSLGSIVLPPDPNYISILLERAKAFLSEIGHRYEEVEMCKHEREPLFLYPDILLPSEERRINRTVDEIQHVQETLEERLSQRIQCLETAIDACQTLGELLTEKMDWLNGIRSQFRKMERDLIKSESELSERLHRMENMLHSLLFHEKDEMNEIDEKLKEFQKLGGDGHKFDSAAAQVLAVRNQLIDEVRWKAQSLRGIAETYMIFSSAVKKFEEWYSAYMCKISKNNHNPRQGDFVRKTLKTYEPQIQFKTHPSLVKEREERKVDFLEILSTARKLRVSVFDPSLLDHKIETLQNQWRTLIETVYRSQKIYD